MMRLDEAIILRMVRTCSVLAVLTAQLNEYRNRYGSDPQMIIMHTRLRGPIAREVFQAFGIPPIEAVIEPVWIGSIPMIFRNLGRGEYIHLTNNATRQLLIL
jgi:hypothetical protein